MNRRKFLATLGAATGISATVGTGAFSRTEAKRNVSVSIADDDRAFLRLEPLVDRGINQESTRRSFSNGQTVGLEILGNGDGENPDTEGVGLNSVYEFHNLLEVINQGTQPVQLRSNYDGARLADLALVNDNGVLRDEPPALGVGKSINVGLLIDTHGSETGEFDETLTIVADQPDE